MAAQRIRRQLAEGALVAFREAPQMHEAIVHGDLGDVAHLGRRIAQPAMDLLQLALTDVRLRRGVDLALEQQIERAQAHVGQLGQLFDRNVTLQMLIYIVGNPPEGRATVAKRIAADVAGQAAEQLAGDDPAVLLLNLRNALLGPRLLADQSKQAAKPIEFAERVAVAAEANPLRRSLPLVFATSLLQKGGRQFDDEFLAVFRIGQVDRVVRIDQQQLAGREIVLLPPAAPQAMTALQQLQVINGFQRR